MIIIKASADRKDQLGSLFGLQQSCSSIARAIAPACTSSLFAIMIDNDGSLPGGGITKIIKVVPGLVWVVMILCSMGTVRLAMNVRDVPAVIKRR